MACAACEIGSQRIWGSRQCAIANAITIDILIAGKAAKAGQVFGTEYLSAIKRLVRISKRFGHPQVHTEIKIAQAEDNGLQPFREIECLPAEIEAFLHISGKQDN